MRSTSWETEKSINENDMGKTAYQRNSAIPTKEVRFYKRLLENKKVPEGKIVFIVRSTQSKTEIGQIVYIRETGEVKFVSTIHTFAHQGLSQITEFMLALRFGLIDELVIGVGNEVMLPA